IWATTPPMPTPRSFLATRVINNTLYAAGGTIRNTGLATVEAYTPTQLNIIVAVDIKPGRFPNRINLGSQGRIPVAILSTDTFDATTVDPSTVLFGITGTEAAPVRAALEDVNGDGRVDLILQINVQDTGITCGDISASLTGKTVGGQTIQGSDSIETVGC